MTLKASVLIRRSVACFVFVWAMSAAFASAGPILSINPTTTTVNVGEIFGVDVNIAGVTDLFLFNFDVIFDDTLLDPVFFPPDPADPFDPGGFSVEGSFLSQGGETVFNAGVYDGSDPGNIAFISGVLAAPVTIVQGGGTLATVMCTAKAAGQANFLLTGDFLQDSSGNLIAPDAIGNASVTINNINNVDDTTTVGQLLSILLCATAVGAIVRRRFERISRS